MIISRFSYRYIVCATHPNERHIEKLGYYNDKYEAELCILVKEHLIKKGWTIYIYENIRFSPKKCY